MISARLNSLLLFVARSMTPRMLRLASALQVRAESQQTAIAILHHELALVPGHVAKSPSEFHALGGVLGIKCVGIFNEEVRVEQFVRVFVRIGGGRLGATEMNHLLVARHDGVDRRILPRHQTCEAKLACVIGERCGNVHGEEYGRNLTEHVPSLPQMAGGLRFFEIVGLFTSLFSFSSPLLASTETI